MKYKVIINLYEILDKKYKHSEFYSMQSRHWSDEQELLLIIMADVRPM